MESRGVLALAFFGQVQTSSKAPWKLMLTILSAGIEAMIAEDCWYKNASICLSWGEFHEVSLVLLVLNITILSITSDATDKVRNLSREVSCLSFGTWDLCEEDRTVWTPSSKMYQLDPIGCVSKNWPPMIYYDSLMSYKSLKKVKLTKLPQVFGHGTLRQIRGKHRLSHGIYLTWFHYLILHLLHKVLK